MATVCSMGRPATVRWCSTAVDPQRTFPQFTASRASFARSLDSFINRAIFSKRVSRSARASRSVVNTPALDELEDMIWTTMSASYKKTSPRPL